MLLLAGVQAQAQTMVVGMSEEQSRIGAYDVPAQIGDAPRVLVIGSLSGDAASANSTRAGYEAYVNEPENFLDVIFIPGANPDYKDLRFPPQGAAYADDWTSWSLWRWIGLHAPDGVVIMGADKYDLGQALEQGIMGLGGIPHTVLEYENELAEFIRGRKSFPKSEARARLEARLERSTEAIAEGLAASYGRELGYLTYIPGMALIGRMRLGQLEEVRNLLDAYLAANPAVEINNSLQIAGHLVFAELAERTGEARYLEAAKRAADLGFDSQGRPLEAMPFHGDYSDAFFMATPLLAKVGKLTRETRYFDLALNHVEHMHAMLLREDGLYNHWPRADAAWGRGNAFVALGLALALADFPVDHPGYARLLEIYRAHMRTLIQYVDVDGMWHNVINMPGSWAELSATAMIATAMQRGINEGWLEGFYQGVVNSAWEGVLLRTDEEFGFVNVCESTPGQESLEAYLNREALIGRDDRAGGMMLMLATERLRPADR